MTLSTKRFLVLFSVCLNIGFIAVAAFLVLKHPPHGEDANRPIVLEVVEELELPDSTEKAVAEHMDEFHSRIRALNQEIWNTRQGILRSFAEPGLPDDKTIAAKRRFLATLDQQRGDLALEHFRKMKRLLGDEAGRKFFLKMEERVGKRRPRF